MTTLPLFLKTVCITPGAQDEVPANEILSALDRHCRGDWGEVCEDDRQENKRSLQNGARLLSVFRSQTGVKFWIITDAGHETTTILLPMEY